MGQRDYKIFRWSYLDAILIGSISKFVSPILTVGYAVIIILLLSLLSS